jgi:Transglutaminase-like superfamily
VRLLLISISLATFTPFTRAETAPPPRLDVDTILRVFLDKLKANEPRAAHAMVHDWANPYYHDRNAFAKHWERLVSLHGPIESIHHSEHQNTVAAYLVQFRHTSYYFLAGAEKQRISLMFSPYPTLRIEANKESLNEGEGQAQLLWAGRGVYVRAEDASNPKEGVITFAIPGLYREQVPLTFKVAADPPSALRGYRLRPRHDVLNWLCDVTVAPGKTEAIVFWESIVLTKPSEPTIVGNIEKIAQPEVRPEVSPWLRTTSCAQSDDPRIQKLAKQLASNENEKSILKYAQAVESWVDTNRGTGADFDSLDAATALGCGGSCTSRSNLATALLRARGIPARTVDHLPLDAGPHATHWLTEYWQPGAGWSWLEPAGRSVHTRSGGAVVLSVATPEDEDDVVWPNRRSGIMRGAPRYSMHEFNGPIRWRNPNDADPRTWGICIPLMQLHGRNDEMTKLFTLARQSHVGLLKEGPDGRENWRRRDLFEFLARSNTTGLISCLKNIVSELKP